MHRLPSCSVGRSRRADGEKRLGVRAPADARGVVEFDGRADRADVFHVELLDAGFQFIQAHGPQHQRAICKKIEISLLQHSAYPHRIFRKTAITSDNFDWRNRLLLQINSDRKITKIDCGQTLIWIDSGSNVRWRTNELPNDMHMNKFRSLNYSDLTRQVSKTRVYSIEHF